ncbi:MAG: hypothetical protein IJT98_00070 [Prevotella sp.]|nr:hypothetical protein [Prevotella sp.]
MKKTYITPATDILKCSTASLIAASPDGFTGKLGSTETNGESVLVKDEQRSDYNVWDDDWSR